MRDSATEEPIPVAQAEYVLTERIAALEAENRRLHSLNITVTKKAWETEADLAAARAALEAVEWVDYDGWLWCPWCKNYKNGDGHAADCARQVGLGLAKKP